MLVRTATAIEGTPDDVAGPHRRGKRLLHAAHNAGFSLEETTFSAGTSHDFQHCHHVEAVFITQGEGVLLDQGTGETHPLRPGTVYVLDGHEHHQVHATTDLHAVCVFKPPIDQQPEA